MWHYKLSLITANSYCTKPINSGKILYKYLLKKCKELPAGGPQKFYIYSVKQSFKQHINETDPERIQQIIQRAYEDADWILKKVCISNCVSSLVYLTIFST